MKMISRWTGTAALVASLVLGAAAAGCGSQRFKHEEKMAKTSVERAEEAGAETEAVKRTLAFAEEAEDEAQDEIEDARQDLEDARDRHEEWTRRKAEKEGELDQAMTALDRHHADLRDAEDREHELRGKGLTSSEVRGAMSGEVPLVKLRIQATEATIDSLEKQVDLADLMIAAAEMSMTTAEARISSGEQRLEVARALYAEAAREAKVLEAEQLRARGRSSTERLEGL
jgi:uncharacterized protein (DUF3084 family)